MNEKIEYWLDLAEYDMETAKAMLQTGRYLYVGFMCHQVIEKALKAVIARDCAEDEIPPKIHDLPRLAKIAGLLGKVSEEQHDFIDKLTPLNIESRYPEYKNKIFSTLSEKVCDNVLAETERLLCWIKQQL